MNNPLRILQSLERHLTAPAELTLFGRAALTLSYFSRSDQTPVSSIKKAMTGRVGVDKHLTKNDFQTEIY